jgi:hypothetical protein
MDDSIGNMNKTKLAVNFIKCVKGYHMLNNNPINETIWETINLEILESSGYKVINTSNGSHLPGMDIKCELGSFSNKSAKYNKNKDEFSISSYRLTTVCSDKNCGNITNIISEINSRKNYDYYSVIIRNELIDIIEYDWYLIPADYLIFNPESYNWIPMLGKRGNKIGEQIGWKTNQILGSKMAITFSMSSQLWLTISVTDELKKFIIGTCSVSNKNMLNYSKIYDIFNLDLDV